jgi:ring-1,2-phenylacetyl-CoA epoxidase subunit PaaC
MNAPDHDVRDDRGDNPYDLLAADADDTHRWAFGTGFTDPLDGVDTAVPAGVDAAELAQQCLALGDDALVYSHRLQEWLTRLPELEEETAIANIALDLLGQARLLLARAGRILGRTEDELAFFRAPDEFRNVRLVEAVDHDFAGLVGRLLVFSAWRLAVLDRLTTSADPVLAAIAAKGGPELTYHRDYAAGWVVRLGDGTGLSHARMQAALDGLWPGLDELFEAESGSPGRDVVESVLEPVLAAAGLRRPPAVPPGGGERSGEGRAGRHTPALESLLTELQAVARQFPDATW